MSIEEINNLTADGLLDGKTYDEIFDVESITEREHLKVALRLKAKQYQMVKAVEQLLSAYEKLQKKLEADERAAEKPVSLLENWTNFDGDQYPRMQCKQWIATDEGIYAQNSGAIETLACYHPILPIRRLKNMQTGDEQITLAYKRNGAWREITVPKTMVTSANKIVGLSSQGISVTSENAKLLVKYLADVENANDDYIPVEMSTSKLGWHEHGTFVPYDAAVRFDGDMRFRQVFEAVSEHGDRDAWFNHVKQVRKTGRIEPRVMLAASFASVLVKPLGVLPFFVDLWGETEGGKTVTLMLAASVWANPDENKYIGDFKSTDVALEAKADMLNNLPMILDDTSKVSRKIHDNFEGVIYDMCSGKGKSRSNRELGINRENNWKNCILCNGEQPLSGYVSQGGAINRIIEVQCSPKIFDDPQKTADVVKKNYGFAGALFVTLLQTLDIEEITRTFEEFEHQLMASDKMQKQAMSVAVILTADKLITDHLFEDGMNITVEEAKKLLVDRNDVSDNIRCFRYLQDKVAANEFRFFEKDDEYEDKYEKWGCMLDGDVCFIPTMLNKICKEEGFNRQSFTAWGKKNGIVITNKSDPKRDTFAKKVDGKTVSYVRVRINANLDDDWETLDEDDVVFD